MEAFSVEGKRKGMKNKVNERKEKGKAKEGIVEEVTEGMED